MNHPQQNLNDASEGGLHAIDYWQVLKSRWAIILLTAIVVFLAALVFSKYGLPKKYRSVAAIQIYYPHPTYDPLASQGSAAISGATPTRNYIENQLQLITSERNLKRVAEKLDLVSEWNLDNGNPELALDSAVGIIRSVTSVGLRPNSEFVNIQVEHTEPEECREIAREVAYVYKEQRQLEEDSRVEQSLNTLNKGLIKQGKVVAEKREALDQLTKITGDLGGSNPLEKSAHEDAYKELQNLRQQKEYIETQIKAMLDKSDKEIIPIAANIDLVTSRVPDLYRQFIANERALEGLKGEGRGPKHPLMITAVKQHNELLEDLYDSVTDMRKSLNLRLEEVKSNIEQKEKYVDGKKGDALKEKLSGYEIKEAQREYDQAKAILDRMTEEQATQAIRIESSKLSIDMREEPKTPTRHSFPDEKMLMTVGGALGLVLGISLAFLLELSDSSVKSLDDIERYLQLPVLAVIPKDIDMLHKVPGGSPDAEAYRILRTNIEFNKRRSPEDNCISVVSGGAGEGKSTTLINLAYVCAQGGYSTLIVDADLRRPRLHAYFEINNSVGLSNYLTEDLKLEDVILQTPTENLYFMSSGITQSDPAGILNSNRMSGLISDVKERFDLVFIDSPPILGISDASVICSECDQTMIVVQHRKLPRNILVRVKQSIEAVGGSILGVVLNNVDIKSDSQYQYYTSYYTYYSAEQQSPAPTPQKKNQKENLTAASNDESIY